MSGDKGGVVYTTTGHPFYSGFSQHDMRPAKTVGCSLFRGVCVYLLSFT